MHDEFKLSRKQHLDVQKWESEAKKQMASDITSLVSRKHVGVSMVLAINSGKQLINRLEKRGHVIEQWDYTSYDLASVASFEAAKRRLLEVRPRHV